MLKCGNCKDIDIHPDSESVHSAPCSFCLSDGHAGCQHIDESCYDGAGWTETE